MGAKTRKIRVRQNWPGCFLSLTVSRYHIFTLSKSFGRSKGPSSGSQHSGYPEAATSVRINRKPLKSYSNHPKIIRLLPTLHEQLEFSVRQHRRAVVSCGFIWSRIWPQNRIPRTQISLSPNINSIRLQLLEKILFQLRC